MANFLSQLFGGGKQEAPQYKTVSPSDISGQYFGQDFDKSIATQAKLTKGVSTNNLDTYKSLLSSIDPNALSNLQSKSNTASALLSGSTASLPSWLSTFMSNTQRQGAEGATARGLGTYSGAGTSAIRNYAGDRGMQLYELGSNLSDSTLSAAGNIANRAYSPYDVGNTLMSMGQLTQLNEFNTGIQNQQAEANAAVENYNESNSPWANLLKGITQIGATLGGKAIGSGIFDSVKADSGSDSGTSRAGGFLDTYFSTGNGEKFDQKKYLRSLPAQTSYDTGLRYA